MFQEKEELEALFYEDGALTLLKEKQMGELNAKLYAMFPRFGQYAKSKLFDVKCASSPPGHYINTRFVEMFWRTSNSIYHYFPLAIIASMHSTSICNLVF